MSEVEMCNLLMNCVKVDVQSHQFCNKSLLIYIYIYIGRPSTVTFYLLRVLGYTLKFIGPQTIFEITDYGFTSWSTILFLT